MQRKEERSDEGGGIVALPPNLLADEENERRIEGVHGDVEEVEAPWRRIERPVQRIARLEERAHAGAGVVGERAPRVHRRVVNDDVVVVELERPEERRQVDDEGRRREYGGRVHNCCSTANARSRRPTAFHQRSRALRSTSTTRTPFLSAMATRQLPARPVVPVFTP